MFKIEILELLHSASIKYRIKEWSFKFWFFAVVYCASSDSRMSKTQTTSILQYSNIILKWFNCSNYRHSPPIQLSPLIFFMISFCPKDPHNIILTWGCQTHQTSCKTLYLGMCFLRQKKWNETCTRDLLGNRNMKIVLFKIIITIIKTYVI